MSMRKVGFEAIQCCDRDVAFNSSPLPLLPLTQAFEKERTEMKISNSLTTVWEQHPMVYTYEKPVYR